VSGQQLIVDGSSGRVIVEPDIATLDEYKVRMLNYSALVQEQQQSAMAELYNGDERLFVFANAGSVEDVERAIAAGADGIGLFRSEFLYMQSSSEPTEQQQYEAYASAARACNGKPLVIRTLDIGGDKAVPYLGFAHEENPFLGWRAIRVSLECREMFCRQLRAILRASAEGDVRVMFPMVVTLEELQEAKQLLEQCKEELKSQVIAYNYNIKVGVMIETPAAVLIADSLAEHCDFFSIGTNDLVQYVMAADRANAKVSNLYNPYSTAVLRAIKMVISAADEAGIECGMCGELASDSQATEMLLGMHLREFSVNIGSISKIKYNLNKLIN
jgi:phosphotransferase system enzyme I (PtsI)